MEDLRLIGRSKPLFDFDINNHHDSLLSIVRGASFLVIGGAGSIGSFVTKEIFKLDPLKLHVVDISENNLVELVRDIRSTLGYGSGDFSTFALDCGSFDFKVFFSSEGPYDYIFEPFCSKACP